MRTPSPSPERTAVVIGASVAGLCAAAALAEHMDRVIIVERDRIDEDTTFRKGVPQGRHVHALLARGQTNLEKLFPGLVQWCLDQGAAMVNIGDEGHWWLLGGFRPRYLSGVTSLGVSRPLLERGIRTFALQNAKIELRSGLDLVGYLSDEGRSRVLGVRCRESGGEGAEREILASLVVDASGRGSRTPRLLEALGLPAPAETVVTSKAGYASCAVRLAPDPDRHWKVCYVQPSVGGGTRGAIIAAMEDDLFMVTLIGMAGDHPPTDEAGFLSFARSLPTPVIAETLERATPVSPIVRFAGAENRLRHYDRLPRTLDGLVALGDAVYALNPVYGQGMTVASMAALALGEVVGQRRTAEGIRVAGVSAEFQKKLTKVIALPWQMATSEDLRWPIPENQGRVGLADRALSAWVDRVQLASLHDWRVTETFYRVAQMVDGPAALLSPSMVARVLRVLWTLRGSRPMLNTSQDRGDDVQVRPRLAAPPVGV